MRKVLIVILFILPLFRLTGGAQSPSGNGIVYRNLALHASVTVSSVGEKGLDGENAMDGDTLTRWSSAWKDDEWIQVDLKKAYPVDRIVIKWEVAYTAAYILQASPDGVKWTDVFNENNGDGRTDVIALPSLPARYLRLLCVRRGTRFGSSLWELEVYSNNHPIAMIEDFEAPGLKGWSGSENYLLNPECNTLRIEKSPSPSGMLSGSVLMTMPQPIPTADYPFFSFKSKANKNLRLIVKLEYRYGMATTITSLLNSDNRWHKCSYALEPSQVQLLEKLSFQLISAVPDKDTIILYLDDITIGYQGNIQKTHKGLLQKLVRNAETYLLLSGDNIRQFPENARTRYKNEIQRASEVLNNASLAQIEIDKAVEQIMIANADIEASVVLPPTPMKTCNPDATSETRFLYNNLKLMEGRAIFFGQMDPFFLNGNPTGNLFQSDIEDICGSLPALGSWELKNIGAGFMDTLMCREVEYYYNKNGIISFCWHMMDPAGRGFYTKDIPDPYAGNELLPGGKHHEWFLGQLDRIAFFFRQLKGQGGESIPVLFRPFHEMDGDWFWWGKPYVSAETFARLWQFTYDYLTKVKRINNLLFVFSPCDRFKARDGELGYLHYYPGDSYVDVLAQDNYGQARTAADSGAFVNQLRIMTKLAEEKNKISALSETGLDGLGIHDWFTQVLLKPVKNDSLARRVTYMAIWNRSFVPYPGHLAVPDFLKFYQDPVTLFMGDYPDLYHGLIKD